MIFWFFDTTISSWKQLHSDRASYSIITESQEKDNMQTDIRRTQACNHLQLNVVHLTVTWCKCFGIKRQSKTSFHYQLHCFRLYSCMSQLECNKAFWGTRDKYRVAGKSLAWPGRKQAQKHVRDARDFNNIKMRADIKFFFLQGKAPKEIRAILTETLACFLPGQAKDLSAPLYI